MLSKSLPLGLFTMLLFVFTFQSCTSDDEPDYWGEVSAMKNGVPWTAEVYAFSMKPNNNGSGFIAETFNAQGFRREHLYLYKIPSVEGYNEIHPTLPREEDGKVGVFYTTVKSDGDVSGDSYNLLQDDIDDYIDIQSIKGDVYEGTFQFSITKDTNFIEGDHQAPDTLIFTEGYFSIKIRD